MLFIVTALHGEAEPLLAYYGLKKIIPQPTDRNSKYPFPIFRSADVMLCVSGTGPVNSIAATAFLLSQNPSAAHDWLLNIGICGGADASVPTGTVVYPHTLSDTVTGRDFYPEMLYRHPFTEGKLCSFPAVVTPCTENGFADMEAAFIFQTASKFMPLQRIIILKVLSDYGDTEHLQRMTKTIIAKYIRDALPGIIPWLNQLCLRGTAAATEKTDLVNDVFGAVERPFTASELQAIDAVTQNLHLTHALRLALVRNCRVYIARTPNHSLTDVLAAYTHCACTSKQEGKKYFAQLQNHLLA